VVERELCALDVHPTNLHQLQDVILSILANISKENFQHLVESMPRRIKAVLKPTGSVVPNNPLGECMQKDCHLQTKHCEIVQIQYSCCFYKTKMLLCNLIEKF